LDFKDITINLTEIKINRLLYYSQEFNFSYM